MKFMEVPKFEDMDSLRKFLKRKVLLVRKAHRELYPYSDKALEDGAEHWDWDEDAERIKRRMFRHAFAGNEAICKFTRTFVNASIRIDQQRRRELLDEFHRMAFPVEEGV